MSLVYGDGVVWCFCSFLYFVVLYLMRAVDILVGFVGWEMCFGVWCRMGVVYGVVWCMCSMV